MKTGGVAAFSNAWKTDTFDVSERKIDLRVEHQFWAHTTTTTETGDYIVSHVKVTNTGTVPLKEVMVWVDVDDDSPRFDAFLCDSSGTILSDVPCLTFGDLAPGQSSSQLSYWWTVRQRMPGTGDGSHPVRLTVAPEFTVKLDDTDSAFQSTSTLDAS